MWTDMLGTDSNGERFDTLRLLPNMTDDGSLALAGKNFDGTSNLIVADYEVGGITKSKPITLNLTEWDLMQKGDVVGNMAVRHHFGSLTTEDMTALRLFAQDFDYAKQWIKRSNAKQRKDLEAKQVEK